MCLKTPISKPSFAGTTATATTDSAATPGIRLPTVALPPPGSRRRRLWELDGHAHCPVIGVCLPIAALRRLVSRVSSDDTQASDYELHCNLVSHSKARTAIAEAAQKELDRRFQLTLQQAARLKTTDTLAQWWHETSAGKDLPGALWATLTHPRCTRVLEDEVLGEVHMLQHQVGMATRVELARFEALIDENAVLTREWAGAQERSLRQSAEFARRSEQSDRELMHLRAQLIARDTDLAQQREQQALLEAAAPELRSRFELARENRAQADRILDLQRALLQAQQESERQRRRAEDAAAAAETQRRRAAAQITAPDSGTQAVDLQDRSVLCVGGRPASVPVYRQLIERTGGRFLHHDGGSEESAARLDATLAAADLVICQTGCISHDAYWRVKDHCKRTGKRCVFVDAPSKAALERALGGSGGGGGGPANTTDPAAGTCVETVDVKGRA